MELVYLWVEDYNGIKDKDLNFGSKYRCAFTLQKDKKKKVPFGTLDIKYNDDFQYMDSFFKDNIKVSAIAGKNGSGKSSLLDLIWNGQLKQDKKFFAIFENDDGKLHLIAAEANKDLIPMSSASYQVSFSLGYNTTSIDKLTTFLFTNEAVCIEPIVNNFQIASNQVFSSIECELRSKINKSSQATYTILSKLENYFGIGVDSLTDEATEQAGKYFKEFKTVLLSHEKLELDITSNIFEKSLAIIYDDSIPWYDDFERPKKVYMGIDTQVWDNFLLEHNTFPSIDNVTQMEEKFFIYYAVKWFDHIKSEPLPSKINEKYESIYTKYFTKQSLNANDIDELNKEMREEYDYADSKVSSKIYYYTAKDYFIKLEELKNSLYKLKENSDIQNDSLILTINANNKKLISNFVNTHISLLKEGIAVASLLRYRFDPLLSSGHQSTLEIFGTLYDKISSIENNKVLLLLDEIEAYLHPRWQRDFLFLLINFLSIEKFKDKKFHIILATHSPFILSDIPKDHIAFLGENDNIDQTFGANIHTLLSDGFFMDDGLMGKFARTKIEDVISFLNYNGKGIRPKIKTYLEAEKIIKTVGEPILRMKLEKMFESYMVKNKIKTEAEIKKEISRLEQELKELNND